MAARKVSKSEPYGPNTLSGKRAGAPTNVGLTSLNSYLPRSNWKNLEFRPRKFQYKNILHFQKKYLHFLENRGIIPKLLGDSKQNIRVWRSLVSRLNGVQEAAGSNPVTRTTEKSLLMEAPICGCSSSGRAPPCQGGGSEFEPRHPLHTRSLIREDRGFFVPKIRNAYPFSVRNSADLKPDGGEFSADNRFCYGLYCNLHIRGGKMQSLSDKISYCILCSLVV